MRTCSAEGAARKPQPSLLQGSVKAEPLSQTISWKVFPELVWQKNPEIRKHVFHAPKGHSPQQSWWHLVCAMATWLYSAHTPHPNGLSSLGGNHIWSNFRTGSLKQEWYALDVFSTDSDEMDVLLDVKHAKKKTTTGYPFPATSHVYDNQITGFWVGNVKRFRETFSPMANKQKTTSESESEKEKTVENDYATISCNYVSYYYATTPWMLLPVLLETQKFQTFTDFQRRLTASPPIRFCDFHVQHRGCETGSFLKVHDHCSNQHFALKTFQQWPHHGCWWHSFATSRWPPQPEGFWRVRRQKMMEMMMQSWASERGYKHMYHMAPLSFKQKHGDKEGFWRVRRQKMMEMMMQSWASERGYKHMYHMAPLSFKQKHGDKNIPRKSQRSHSSRIHWSHWDWRFNTNWEELCWHFGLQSLYVNPGVTIDALTTELMVDPFIWPHSPKDHGNISHTVAKGSLPTGLMNESTWGNMAKSRKAWQNDRTQGSESRFIEDKMWQSSIPGSIFSSRWRCLSLSLAAPAPCTCSIFIPEENNEKGLQKTMRVKRNACLAVNCKPSNNWSSKGPLCHHTQLLHCSARVSRSHLDV